MAIPVEAMDERGLRNFREFLEVYNKISQICFNHCAVTLNRAGLTEEEADCCDRCTVKNYNVNHRVLSAFMVEQPKITEKKMEEAQKEAEAAVEKMKAAGKDPAEAVSAEAMTAQMMAGMQSTVPNPSNSNS